MKRIFLTVVLCTFLVYGCYEKSDAVKNQQQQDVSNLQ